MGLYDLKRRAAVLVNTADHAPPMLRQRSKDVRSLQRHGDIPGADQLRDFTPS